MARPTINIERQKANGRRFSKKQIEEKTREPVKVGEMSDNVLKNIPDEVKRSPEALRKWKYLETLYRGKDYIGSGDVGVITRYCILHAHEVSLRAAVEQATNRDDFDLDTVVRAHRALDSKCRLITLLEDKLFLNPLSKMRGLPPEKRKPVEEIELESLGFGDI